MWSPWDLILSGLFYGNDVNDRLKNFNTTNINKRGKSNLLNIMTLEYNSGFEFKVFWTV